jgi:peptide deformylase
MAARKILTYPSNILGLTSNPIDIENCKRSEILNLVKDLVDTMKVNYGAGLAAPQIGVTSRVVVISMRSIGSAYDPDPTHPDCLVLINPEFISYANDKKSWKEGCLSVPGVSGNVERSSAIVVNYYDSTLQKKNVSFDWPSAGIVQHECDHLDGKLYIDKMRPLSRRMILKKYNKINRTQKIEQKKKDLELESLDYKHPALSHGPGKRNKIKR